MMASTNSPTASVALLLVGLVWGCVWSPTMALYDGVLVNEARARGFVYGTLRVWGSVAFIAGTLICGWPSTISVRPRCFTSVGWAVVCLLPFALVLPRGDAPARGNRPSRAVRHLRSPAL